jgi:hypothetical protein
VPTFLNGYYGIQVVLSDTGPYPLFNLLAAIDSSLEGVIQDVSYLAMQLDDASGGNALLVGDSKISLTRYAYRCLSHDQIPYRSQTSNIPLKAIWVMAVTAPCTLNVEIIP